MRHARPPQTTIERLEDQIRLRSGMLSPDSIDPVDQQIREEISVLQAKLQRQKEILSVLWDLAGIRPPEVRCPLRRSHSQNRNSGISIPHPFGEIPLSGLPP